MQQQSTLSRFKRPLQILALVLSWVVAIFLGSVIAGVGNRKLFDAKCPPLSLPQATADQIGIAGKPGFKPATPLSRPLEPYPRAGQVARVQGNVLLQVLVRADGHVMDARVVRSSGFCPFDLSAIHQVEQWKYQPATFEGKAIEAWHPLTFAFRLGGMPPMTLLKSRPSQPVPP
jgi:TonB family protein